MIVFGRHATAVVALIVLGLATGARPVGADSGAELEGSWGVARATMNGEPRADAKVLNATWTFRGNELVVQTARGERLRSSLSFDATANPPAFHVTPLGGTGDSLRPHPTAAMTQTTRARHVPRTGFRRMKSILD